MWSVWRTVLEENEKLARARLAAVEVFQQQIADDVKLLRAHKIQTARRVSLCLIKILIFGQKFNSFRLLSDGRNNTTLFWKSTEQKHGFVYIDSEIIIS